MSKAFFLFSLVILASTNVYAHEGMWLMNMLQKINEAEMQNLGLNLSAEDIYDINNASLKDAIVRLNGGMCTAGVISNEGLLLTNHHCAYGAIQAHSDISHNYLDNGFWAKKHEDELPIENFEVSFLVRIDDVTSDILQGVTESMDENERARLIESKIQELQSSAGTDLDIEIKSFFYGSEFYQFTYETFSDVRLVGAPPQNLGKFGGDIDNWKWPRHTSDFALLRIYSDKYNQPANFSLTNSPHSPKSHLKISTDQLQEGDFSMVIGYPGSTDRYLSSYGVDHATEINNPTIVTIRDAKLRTMKKHMDASDEVRLKYSANYSSVANYWKYYVGQTEYLKLFDTKSKKEELEEQFENWVSGSPLRQRKYGDVLDELYAYYSKQKSRTSSDIYCLEAGLIGSNISLFGFRINRMLDRLELASSHEKEALLQEIGLVSTEFFGNYDSDLEEDLYVELMTLYRENNSKDDLPSIFQEIDAKFQGSIERFASKMFSTSILTDETRFKKFMQNPNFKKYKKNDLAAESSKSLTETYFKTRADNKEDEFEKLQRLYVQGLREMKSGKTLYPNANSTMRLSYGIIDSYNSVKGEKYDFYTTIDEILDKQDFSDPYFTLQEDFIDLIESKDFGQWSNNFGELPVCFISSNDITGGNSGSPILNGNGDLIGCVFDSNWEGMTGDIDYVGEYQRTISVHINYILWFIEKYVGANHLVQELDLSDQPSPQVNSATAPVLSLETGSIDISNGSVIRALERNSISFNLKNSSGGLAQGLLARVSFQGSISGIKSPRLVELPSIAVGDVVRCVIPIETDRSTENGFVKITIEIVEPNGFAPAPFTVEIPTKAFKSPAIKVVDFASSHSTWEPLVPIQLDVLVQNIGTGDASEVIANLELPKGIACLSDNTNTRVKTLAKGEMITIKYDLLVPRNYNLAEITPKVTLTEKYGDYGSTWNQRFTFRGETTVSTFKFTDEDQSSEEHVIKGSLSTSAAGGGDVTFRKTNAKHVIKTVAVVPKDGIDCYGEEISGDELALFTENQLLGTYNVVDRKFIDQTIGEIKFSMSGMTQEDKVLEAGCMLAAEGYVFVDYGCFEGQQTVNVKLIHCETGENMWICQGIGATATETVKEIVKGLSE